MVKLVKMLAKTYSAATQGGIITCKQQTSFPPISKTCPPPEKYINTFSINYIGSQRKGKTSSDSHETMVVILTRSMNLECYNSFDHIQRLQA